MGLGSAAVMYAPPTCKGWCVLAVAGPIQDRGGACVIIDGSLRPNGPFRCRTAQSDQALKAGPTIGRALGLYSSCMPPLKPRNHRPSILDEPDQSIQGVFEPPSGFVVSAIGRSKLLICAFAVVIALLGAGYGLSRKRTYTASATLQVGQVNPNSPGFFSYVNSASALATAFSRSVGAEPVLATVQQKLKIAPAKAVARLSADADPTKPCVPRYRHGADGIRGYPAGKRRRERGHCVREPEQQRQPGGCVAATRIQRCIASPWSTL